MKNKNIKNVHAVRKIRELLDKYVEKKVLPGGVVGVSQIKKNCRENIYIPFGTLDFKKRTNVNVFYDIASLTKPIATTLSILILMNKNRVRLDSTISELLDTDIKNEKKYINLRSLLNHSSGLPPHKEYYKGECIDITEIILNEPLEYKTSTKQIYSDLGFILLGKIIEKKSNMKLDDFFNKYVLEPLGIESNMFFNRENIPKNDAVYAPTEVCSWRKKTLCGQVHDDNAYALGGVCGHAGLFANIYGVMDVINFIEDVIKKRVVCSFIKREDLVNFVTRQSEIGSWGLGFDTPSEESSSGRYFSSNSFGHLGFTGTSFWVDIEKGVSIVLLSNRVHPSRKNEKIKELRPLFHDLVMSSLLEMSPL